MSLNVIIYFINKINKRRYIVLGFCKVISKYNSKNIAAILFKIFKDYSISSNIRYFMADNAESNNTCIKVIL